MLRTAIVAASIAFAAPAFATDATTVTQPAEPVAVQPTAPASTPAVTEVPNASPAYSFGGYSGCNWGKTASAPTS